MHAIFSARPAVLVYPPLSSHALQDSHAYTRSFPSQSTGQLPRQQLLHFCVPSVFCAGRAVVSEGATVSRNIPGKDYTSQIQNHLSPTHVSHAICGDARDVQSWKFVGKMRGVRIERRRFAYKGVISHARASRRCHRSSDLRQSSTAKRARREDLHAVKVSCRFPE